MRSLHVVFVLSSLLAGCGGVVSAQCSSQTSGTLEIVVPQAHQAAEVVMLGDCRSFSCAQPTGSGCLMWKGEISTAPGSTCRVALVEQNAVVDTTDVDGQEACGTTAASVSLGGSAPLR